jgi:hypothetical protein
MVWSSDLPAKPGCGVLIFSAACSTSQLILQTSPLSFCLPWVQINVVTGPCLLLNLNEVPQWACTWETRKGKWYREIYFLRWRWWQQTHSRLLSVVTTSSNLRIFSGKALPNRIFTSASKDYQQVGIHKQENFIKSYTQQKVKNLHEINKDHLINKWKILKK